jgi:lysophospholipase L1-like esterase
MHRLIHTTLLLLVSACFLHAQDASPNAKTSSSQKWEKDIAALEASIQKNPPSKPSIVFIGSSSIRRWSTLKEDFPGKPVINLGFGGSQIADSVHFFDRLVLPCEPKQVIFYAGGNDLNAGKKPETVFTDFQAFASKLHTAFPKAELCFISSAPNPKRWSQIENVRQLNTLVRSYCEQDPRRKYIDMHPVMLGPDAQPKPDIFVEDRLHMNAKGYTLWKEVITPLLK